MGYDQAKHYASVAARLNYMGADRPDVTFASKELMRHLSKPTVKDLSALKRAGRFMLGARRLVCKYPWRPLSKEVTILVDANFAGYHQTRLSTVGGVVYSSNRRTAMLTPRL